jgi:peptidyl-prolyl cis-trans isomerase SurA
MNQTFALPSTLRRLLLGLALAIVAMTAMMARAEAQLVAVIVNGDPVTNFDVQQRTKLIELSTHKTPPRHDVIEELIDEKLKLQMMRRYTIPDIDKDVDNAFSNMAKRMRATSKDFVAQLAKSGVLPETLKSRIRAELIWSQIIRGRYQASFQFSERDIQQRLDAKKPDNADLVGFDYTVRPILFVVPRGSPPAAFEARVKEAEALRSTFQSCDVGIPMARGIRFVAVRPQVIKSSADLPQALSDILAKTEIGKLTPPETTREGVEIYAVCGKRQSENAPAKKAIRDEMFNETFNRHSKILLKELRSQAMIEYR